MSDYHKIDKIDGEFKITLASSHTGRASKSLEAVLLIEDGDHSVCFVVTASGKSQFQASYTTLDGAKQAYNSVDV